MRSLVLTCSALLLLALPRSSPAAFHSALMDELMTSYGGDPNVQFVEIRMLGGGQNIVGDTVLATFDTSGSYIGDALVVPSDLLNSGSGVRWIMATARFQTLTGLQRDFTIPPASLPTAGGMVCWGAPGVVAPPPTWDRTVFSNYVDCFAYGTYSGPSNLHIGTPTLLDADGHSLVRVSNTDDNATDLRCGDPANPTNNAGASASLAATTACPPPPPAAQNPAQQNCINELNKNFAKVAKTQGTEICKCIKNGAKNKLTETIEECLTSDSKGKVDKAKASTVTKAGKKCSVSPDFGATDPNTVNQIAMEKELALIHGIFGSDLDTVIILEGDNKESSKCQVAIAKAVKKCERAKLKEFNQCKKNALKGKDTAQVSTAQELRDACLGTGMNGIPDSSGKIAKACETKLDATITKKCAPPIDTDAAFPPCAGQPLRDCLDAIVECEVCLALNAIDELDRDCDLFDDESTNASCP